MNIEYKEGLIEIDKILSLISQKNNHKFTCLKREQFSLYSQRIEFVNILCIGVFCRGHCSFHSSTVDGSVI